MSRDKPRVTCCLPPFVQPLVNRLPKLKVVMEHITTSEAVAFVTAASANVAATITPQHLLYNRNAIFQVRFVETRCVFPFVHARRA